MPHTNARQRSVASFMGSLLGLIISISIAAYWTNIGNYSCIKQGCAFFYIFLIAVSCYSVNKRHDFGIVGSVST